MQPTFFKKNNKKKKISAGLSFIEVLIVVTIISLLIIVSIGMYLRQISKGYDAKRKSDLIKIKRAFIDYYNDNECYPPAATLVQYCNGDDIHILDDYIKQVPCDPKTHQPYLYRPYPDNTNTCGGFRVYATLENKNDKDIARLGCNYDDGCGAGEGFEQYNYGISDGVAVSYHESGDTPDVDLPAGSFAVCCESNGSCDSYDASGGSCSQTVYYGTTQDEAVNACEANCSPSGE